MCNDDIILTYLFCIIKVYKVGIGIQCTEKLIGLRQHGGHKDDAAGPVTCHR